MNFRFGIAVRFLLYLAILCIGFSLSFYSGWNTNQYNKKMLLDIKNNLFPVVENSDQILMLTDSLIKSFNNSVITEDVDSLAEALSIRVKIVGKFNNIKTSLYTEKEKSDLERNIQIFSKYFGAAYNLSQLLIKKEKSFVTAQDEILDQNKKVNEFKDALNLMREKNYQRFVDGISISSRQIDSTTNVNIIVMLALFGVIGVIYFIVNSTILKPILLISKTSEQAGNGDLKEIKFPKINNEIGILIVNFNNMISKIKKSRDVLIAINEENQTISSCTTYQELLKILPKSLERVSFGEILLKREDFLISHECFIDNDLNKGFYYFSQDGEGIIPEKRKLFNNEKVYKLPIKDPRTRNEISHLNMEISHKNPKETIQVAEVLTTSIASSLTTIMLEKAMDVIKKHQEEIQIVFDNIYQGIFTVGKDLTIGNKYSKVLEDICQKKDLSGKNFLSGVFFGVSNEVLQNLETFTLCSVGEDYEFGYECNTKIIPKELTREINNKTQILGISVVPIFSEQNIVGEIMFCVEDITQIKKLENETEKNREDLLRIYSILRMGEEKFIHFSKYFSSTMDDIQGFFSDKQYDNKNLLDLKRELHTIKGNSRILGLFDISSEFHDFEKEITHFQITDDKKAINLNLNKLEKLFSQYKRCYTTIFRKDMEYYSLSFEKNQILFYLDKWKNHKIKNISYIRKFMAKRDVNSFDVSYIFYKMVQTFFTIQGIKISYRDSLRDVFVDDKVESILSTCFNHLLNNSIDHGKILDLKARIEVFDSFKDGKYRIFYKDNGKGLNIKFLKQKYLELYGELPDDSQKVADLIFDSGLTSMTNATETSGRGVGMDVIKANIENIGGKIAIELLETSDSKGYLPFQVAFELNSSNLTILSPQEEPKKVA